MEVVEVDTSFSDQARQPRVRLVAEAGSGALQSDPASLALARQSSLRRGLAALFLPVGFPRTVRPEYLEYQAWDTVQALSSYLRGILCTRAVLAGVGVGDATATPLAAAVTWVLRDGAGMTASLWFSWLVGAGFDAHLKEWRLFADLINDVGLCLEMALPRLAVEDPLLVLSAATVCKAVCGVSAGATKSSITAHFSRAGNTADVAAKEGAQETAVTLCGMVLGVLVAQRVEHLRDAWVWAVFLVLTALHVFANWRGVRALRLHTLNRHRLDLLMHQRCPPTPEGVSRAEQLFADALRRKRVAMGCRVQRICRTAADVTELAALASTPPCTAPQYLIGATADE